MNLVETALISPIHVLWSCYEDPVTGPRGWSYGGVCSRTAPASPPQQPRRSRSVTFHSSSGFVVSVQHNRSSMVMVAALHALSLDLCCPCRHCLLMAVVLQLNLPYIVGGSMHCRRFWVLLFIKHVKVGSSLYSITWWVCLIAGHTIYTKACFSVMARSHGASPISTCNQGCHSNAISCQPCAPCYVWICTNKFHLLGITNCQCDTVSNWFTWFIRYRITMGSMFLRQVHPFRPRSLNRSARIDYRLLGHISAGH